MVVSRIALVALSLGLSGVGTAQAAIVSFTDSTLSGAASVLDDSIPAYAGGNLCQGHGTCATALTYNTGVGSLTVTAQDSPDVDRLALVTHSQWQNAGLGVVTGYQNHKGKFVIADSDHSLDSKKETLTLSFGNQVSLSQLFFFPNDRSSHALNSELDKFDGFTLSVDGGALVEYGFGTQGGHPVSFATPLIGSTFTFGYALNKSPEAYFLAGLNVATVPVVSPAVPESSSSAMLVAGLAAVGGVAVRRRTKA